MHRFSTPSSAIAGLFVCVVLVFTSDYATAQFRASIHLGVNGSAFRGGNLQKSSPIASFGGGGALRYEYPSGFEVETGLFYVTKGASLEGTYGEIPIEGTSEITYIEFPFLLGYRFDSNGRFSPRLYAGPAMAFKTDAQISFNAVGSSIVQQEEDLTVKDKDLGLMIGVDVNTKMGSEILSFGVRTTLGYSNARTEKPEIYNTSVAVLVGIVF